MQNVSFKSILSGAFAMLPCLKDHPDIGNPENRIACFLTPTGIVSGKLSSPPTEKTEERDEEFSTLELLTHGLVETSFEKTDMPQKEDCIVLRDVQIRPLDLSSTIEIDCMVLFADQIVGVFAGNPVKR